jgi:hypothetical protein
MSKLKVLGRVFLWLPFAIFALYLILVYSVNFPSDDQWDGEVPFLQNFYSGTADFGDLIAQHVEHRVGVHRLTGVAVAKMFNWDVRAHILVTFALTVFTAFLVTVLSAKTQNGSSKIYYVVLAFSGALLFSPIQIEAWTNPMMPLPYLSTFLLIGIVTAFSGLSQNLRFLICFVICFFSTFTFTTGMLFWVLLLFPVFWGIHAPTSFTKTILLPAWLVGGIISATGYVWKFVSSPDSPGIMPAIQNPLSVAAFFFTAMGAPFAYGTSIDPVSQSFFIGFILVIVFTFLIVKFFLEIIRGKETKIMSGQVLPWLFMGIWPIINIAISAVGRCSYGTEMALSSRYATNSVLLTISNLFIFSILSTHKNDSIKIKAAKSQKIADEKPDMAYLFYEKFLMLSVSILATLYICSIFWIYPHYGMMRSLKTNAKAALMFTKFIVDRDLLGPIWRHESMDPLYPRVEFLEKMGFLTPKRVESLKISSFATALPDFGQNQVGEFDGAAKISENQFQLSGWAVSNDGSRPADSVLLTREFPGQEPEVFALARVGFPRQEIADKFNRKSTLRSGWAKQVSIDETTSSNLVLKAWALDTTTGKITPLSGSVNLSRN